MFRESLDLLDPDGPTFAGKEADVVWIHSVSFRFGLLMTLSDDGFVWFASANLLACHSIRFSRFRLGGNTHFSSGFAAVRHPLCVGSEETRYAFPHALSTALPMFSLDPLRPDPARCRPVLFRSTKKRLPATPEGVRHDGDPSRFATRSPAIRTTPGSWSLSTCVSNRSDRPRVRPD